MTTHHATQELTTPHGSEKRTYALLGIATAGLALLLIVLGALVRVTDAVYGCASTWPLCNGSIFPPLSNHLAWLDWGHRLATVLTGILMLFTVVYVHRRFNHRPYVSRPVYLALGLMVVQSLLGAGTVLLSWPPTLPLLHLGFAVIMFSCLVASLTAALYSPSQGAAPTDTFPIAVHAATLMTFAVLMTGAMVVGDGADRACGGWPLCENPLDDAALINLIHRGSVLLLGIVVVTLVWRARTEWPDGATSFGVFTLGGLFFAQALLGGVYVQYGYSTAVSALHVTFAGLMWATAVALSIAMIKQQELLME